MPPHRPAPSHVLVLGSALRRGQVDRILTARMERALQLWQQHEPRPVLVFSGGRANRHRPSEAAAMQEYAAARGVPAEEVVLEPRSEDTWQNLRNSRPLLPAEARVVVVTSAWHVPRVRRMLRSQGWEAEVVGATSPRRLLPILLAREVLAYGLFCWERLVSRVRRLRGGRGPQGSAS